MNHKRNGPLGLRTWTSILAVANSGENRLSLRAEQTGSPLSPGMPNELQTEQSNIPATARAFWPALVNLWLAAVLVYFFVVRVLESRTSQHIVARLFR